MISANKLKSLNLNFALFGLKIPVSAVRFCPSAPVIINYLKGVAMVVTNPLFFRVVACVGIF